MAVHIQAGTVAAFRGKGLFGRFLSCVFMGDTLGKNRSGLTYLIQSYFWDMAIFFQGLLGDI